MIPRPLATLALGVATLLTSGAAEAGEGFAVGDHFPQVVLPALADGEPLSIASFRGHKVALHVWASW